MPLHAKWIPGGTVTPAPMATKEPAVKPPEASAVPTAQPVPTPSGTSTPPTKTPNTTRDSTWPTKLLAAGVLIRERDRALFFCTFFRNYPVKSLADRNHAFGIPYPGWKNTDNQSAVTRHLLSCKTKGFAALRDNEVARHFQARALSCALINTCMEKNS